MNVVMKQKSNTKYGPVRKAQHTEILVVPARFQTIAMKGFLIRPTIGGRQQFDNLPPLFFVEKTALTQVKTGTTN